MDTERATAAPGKNLQLIGYAELAELLGVEIQTLRTWICSGRHNLPHVRISPRCVRFRRGDVERWIEERSINGAKL